MMHPCLEPGCPQLIEPPRSRCATHEVQAQQRDVERRGSASQRGYDATWTAVRNAYARAHPLCEDHLERGEVVQMDVVDHVIPLPYGPRLDPENLRSRCNPCHAIKTQQDLTMGYEANTAPKPEARRWIIA